MKEHPILFSTEMTKAIIYGKKTMTRRVIQPQPKEYIVGDMLGQPIWYLDGDPNRVIKCLYGRVGDKLWVRESFVLTNHGDPVYKADFRDKRGDYWSSIAVDPKDIKWKPSIHMFRKDSRITLEIVSIKVERIQEIQPYDAEKEGFALVGLKQGCPACDTKDHSYYGGHMHFAEYWQKLNAKRGYSWESNPWVWAIEFKRV